MTILFWIGQMEKRFEQIDGRIGRLEDVMLRGAPLYDHGWDGGFCALG